LAGALLTVYQGGSTSALAATFQDIGLLLPSTNPLVADASGRIPLFFVSDGSYGLRLTDKNGVQTSGGFFYPQIPSIGASSSGGGGSPVDPTTIAQTGDWKWRPSQETLAGWVRLNGRTIGNGSSGASERANADCQALFIYIWTTYSDAICPVLGGRGASALADFNAGKQITLLDMRGRAPFGLDDMGNAALSAFTNVNFTKGNATTGGASGGTNSTTLTAAQIPAHSHPNTLNDPGHNHGVLLTITSFQTAGSLTASANPQYGVNTVANATTGMTITNANNTGGGQAFPSVPSAMLGTHFWKL